MVIIRSFLFNFLFYGLTPIFLILMLPFALLGSQRTTHKIFYIWAKGVLFCLKYCVGLTYNILGYEHLKPLLNKGCFIIACKHQSAWETIIFSQLMNHFRVVLKEELTYIPLLGTYLKKLKSIKLPRSFGGKALKILLTQSKKALQEETPILIFPEGTRTPVGKAGMYRPGIGVLYKSLGVPVIPVCLNSGLFWKRKGFIKKKGCITLQFLDPILPGLDKNLFLQTLEEKIEEGSKALLKL